MYLILVVLSYSTLYSIQCIGNPQIRKLLGSFRKRKSANFLGVRVRISQFFFYKSHFKVLFIEMDVAKGGINWKVFIKGRGAEIFQLIPPLLYPVRALQRFGSPCTVGGNYFAHSYGAVNLLYATGNYVPNCQQHMRWGCSFKGLSFKEDLSIVTTFSQIFLAVQYL